MPRSGLIGLATPVVVYALDFWEHTIGLALMAWAVVLAVDLVRGEAGWRAALGAGLLFGAARHACAPRRSSTAPSPGWSSPSCWCATGVRGIVRIAVAGAFGAAIPILANRLLEQWALGGGFRAARADSTAASGGQALATRVDDAITTTIGLNHWRTPTDWILGGAIVVFLGLAILAFRRRGEYSTLAGVGFMLVAGVVLAGRFTNGVGFVPGLLTASPLVVAGLVLAWRRPSTRIPVVIAVGALPIVWVFQYAGGASPQWGGRYVLLSGFLLATCGVVVLPMLQPGRRRRRRHRRGRRDRLRGRLGVGADPRLRRRRREPSTACTDRCSSRISRTSSGRPAPSTGPTGRGSPPRPTPRSSPRLRVLERSGAGGFTLVTRFPNGAPRRARPLPPGRPQLPRPGQRRRPHDRQVRALKTPPKGVRASPEGLRGRYMTHAPPRTHRALRRDARGGPGLLASSTPTPTATTSRGRAGSSGRSATPPSSASPRTASGCRTPPGPAGPRSSARSSPSASRSPASRWSSWPVGPRCCPGRSCSAPRPSSCPGTSSVRASRATHACAPRSASASSWSPRPTRSRTCTPSSTRVPEQHALIVAMLTPDEARADEPPRLPLVEVAARSRATRRRAEPQRAGRRRHRRRRPRTLHEAGLRVRTLSLFYEQWLGKLPVAELERVSLLFDIGEVHAPRYARVKRLLDLALAARGLVALALVTPFVRDREPVRRTAARCFYRQPRIGRNGVTFSMLKFRTMRVDQRRRRTRTWTGVARPADHALRSPPAPHPPRRAAAGGQHPPRRPRRGRAAAGAAAPRRASWSAKLPFYGLRHLVRPGLTGWAQVKYRYAGTEAETLEKLQYEFFYLRHQSLSARPADRRPDGPHRARG